MPSNPEFNPLKKSGFDTFSRLPKDEKKARIQSEQVVLHTDSENDITHLLSAFEKSGFSSARYKELALALAKMIVDEGISLPSGKKT